MKTLTSLLLLVQLISYAQPGPLIPFNQVIDPINKLLEEDPNNDQARLDRIRLCLRPSSYIFEFPVEELHFDSVQNNAQHVRHMPETSGPLSDIQYLEERWKAGKNKELLSSDLIFSLYGEAYEESEPKLSKKYFRKAANIKQERSFYEGIFEAYNKLNLIDSALLYHDTLNLLFHKNSVDKRQLDGFYYSKIHLLLRKIDFTAELVDYYNWLSTEHFAAYERICESTEEGEYISKHHLEHGLNFQYDLCDYYFKHQRYEQFESLVKYLDCFVPRNKHGHTLNLYPYHRQFKLAGDLALLKGHNDEAIEWYLQAANHMSFYKDTAWSDQILEANKDNPNAHILHGLVSVNRSREGYWHQTEINQNIMNHFDRAQEMGFNYYVISMMNYYNLFVNKEFIEAESLLKKTIASNPFIPQLLDEQYQLNRNMYWSQLLTEEELEKRLKSIKGQAEALRKAVNQPEFRVLIH